MVIGIGRKEFGKGPANTEQAIRLLAETNQVDGTNQDLDMRHSCAGDRRRFCQG